MPLIWHFFRTSKVNKTLEATMHLRAKLRRLKTGDTGTVLIFCLEHHPSEEH